MYSTTNPKFYKKLSKTTSKLINSVTHLKESSENHEICKAYALSQFQNHRFLDVDSNKVDRWVKGLCEKFIIHSKPEKAEILRKLKSDFLELDISETSKARSEIHYSMLCIALNLSDNPVNVDYEPPPPKQPQEAEYFDWARYLLEGEEMPYPSQWVGSDTPYDSEEEIEEAPVLDPYKRLHLPASSSADNYEDEGISMGNLNTTFSLVPEYWKYDLQRHLVGNNPKLEEVNIIREVLWLLSGNDNLYLFPLKDNKYQICADVLGNNFMSDSFKSTLSKISKYGNIVREIQNFIFTGYKNVCQTYQAFAEALLSYMNEFRTVIIDLERRVLLQEETLLLCHLFEILQPRFVDLNIISSILAVSIKQDQKDDSNSKKSARLLGVLYNAVTNETNETKVSGSEIQNTLVLLWIKTLRPYFTIMDSWMTSGTLLDPCQEFVLKRSTKCADVTNDLFWSEAFCLESNECVKQLSWLMPALSDVVVCGKSVEVLVSLGKSAKTTNELSLYERFLQALLSSSETETKDVASTKLEPNNPTSCDGMLRLNFERLFTEKSPEKPQTSFTFDGHSSFPVLLQKSIIHLVQEKLAISSRSLLDVFLNEYGLVSALKCFQKFHLMEWGDVMHDFSVSIFEKISMEEYWTDLTGLRASLQEAISDSNPEADYSFISVSLNREKLKSMGHGIQATDVVTLSLEITWPINIVISEKCQVLYNILFLYLLQLRRVLFSLERLKFDAVYSAEANLSILHRLSLLRAKLLNLVSHWHNFIMTSVIESERDVLFKGIKDAENLDRIISTHNRFLDHVMSLCLLKNETQKEKLVQGTLRKIFDLCLRVHDTWNRKGQVSTKTLRKLESDYKEFSDFLGVVLQNLISRDTVPLGLEALAFCLTSDY